MAEEVATDRDYSGIWAFHDCEINLDTFELKRAGSPVAIEPQVFTLLAYLLRHSDQIVSKDELLDELWGHRFVSEAALSTQLKSLRRAVGDDGQRQAVVQTVRGRGYRFVAALNRVQVYAKKPDRTTPHNLPRERTPLVGRQADIATCRQYLDNTRLITLLGIGGIGKTRLATALGRELVEDFPDGVWMIDLVPLSTVAAIESSMAEVLGLAVTGEDLRSQLIEVLDQQRTLLIFDNCEHVRTEVAELLNELLEYTQLPKFIATSRDPLGLIDEYRFYVEPLATAAVHGVAPAVELFCSTAQRHGMSVRSEGRAAVEAICTQLDGIPLAVELAAAQLRHLTLSELGDRLQRRFEVLAGRERTATGRQSNLAGVLEDTWALLSETEKDLLGQLAYFPGQFTMQCVEEVVGQSAELSQALARIVDLGLMQRSAGMGQWWRVLETVRQFALQHLTADDYALYARRHADWCLRKLGDFPDTQLEDLKQADWCLKHYDDLEAAERYFVQGGELASAYAVCAGTGLMVQLDDGARARDKLTRAEGYLATCTEAYWRGRLHAIAGLCAQANRSPPGLLKHTDAYLAEARNLDDPLLLANALLMKSLTTGFVDAAQAQIQLAEMIQLGEAQDNVATIDAGKCYQAWQFALARDYSRAIDLAKSIVSRFETQGGSVDNPAYNATGIVVTCLVVPNPQEAQRWSQKMLDFPAVSSFWGIENLLACVAASMGDLSDAAQRYLHIKRKLNRATRDEFPDLLVTAGLMAWRARELELAQRWLTVIRNDRVPIQMYHTIVIYRHLYEQLGFNDDLPSLTLNDIRQEVLAWVTEQA